MSLLACYPSFHTYSWFYFLYSWTSWVFCKPARLFCHSNWFLCLKCLFPVYNPSTNLGILQDSVLILPPLCSLPNHPNRPRLLSFFQCCRSTNGIDHLVLVIVSNFALHTCEFIEGTGLYMSFCISEVPGIWKLNKMILKWINPSIYDINLLSSMK